MQQTPLGDAANASNPTGTGPAVLAPGLPPHLQQSQGSMFLGGPFGYPSLASPFGTAKSQSFGFSMDSLLKSGTSTATSSYLSGPPLPPTPLLSSPLPYRLPSPSISSSMHFPGLTPLSPSTQQFFFMPTTPVLPANPATFFPPTMSHEPRQGFPFSQSTSQSTTSFPQPVTCFPMTMSQAQVTTSTPHTLPEQSDAVSIYSSHTDVNCETSL